MRYGIFILILTTLLFGHITLSYYQGGLCKYEPFSTTQELQERETCESYLDYGCSCVIHVQAKCAPISGDAEDVQLNYFGTPFVGDVAKFQYPLFYHVACVETVFPSGNFIVSECNYRAGKCDNTRIVLKDDQYLLGFLHNIKND